ncbi:uncharacterized protein LOC126736117 [Anthonomus grandis grandis]|uniref:uncharacterized protein LOC126736117 n=1 Tax=Anthonomus grandis grandis TaxID=2921223 RepID=UPI0021652BA1|nr:uncharacterized protein LOC126736117 [Anthonomus grandis grandis]
MNIKILKYTFNYSMMKIEFDIDDAVSEFYHILNMAIALFVPLKRFKTSSFPSWFSGELKYLIQQKKISHKKYKSSHTVADYEVFSDLRARCKTLTETCYQNFISNLDQLLYTNPKSFRYKFNNRRATNRLPDLMTYNNGEFAGCEQIAEGFARFFSTVYNRDNNVLPSRQAGVNMTIPNPKLSIGFIFDKIFQLSLKLSAGPDGIPNYFLRKCVCVLSYPLFILFSRSLDLTVFPSEWKLSFITPIFKRGAANEMINYRSECVQSAIPKLLDSLIYDQINFYCKELLLSEQQGFSRGKSAITNLLWRGVNKWM